MGVTSASPGKYDCLISPQGCRTRVNDVVYLNLGVEETKSLLTRLNDVNDNDLEIEFIVPTYVTNFRSLLLANM